MTDVKHVARFNPEAHKRTVIEMRERREEVHSRGEEVYRKTGHLDPLVRVYGAVRESNFAFTDNGDGTFTLVRGPKRPYLFGTDGTGSFGENVGKAFNAAPRTYAILDRFCRGRHQMDFSFAVFQDRQDPHDPVQVPEFESDEGFAGHMRLEIPDHQGGDEEEDHGLGIFYAANYVKPQIARYGGKGIFVLLLDAPGRDEVSQRDVKAFLGFDIQGDIAISEAWKQLLKIWHGFVVVFNPVAHSVNFWRHAVGEGRMILAPSASLFSEIQAGLVYVTDERRPTEEGLYTFLRAGDQGSDLSRSDTHRIWTAYEEARVPFGADPALGVELPKPGDVFASMDHKWPIGHPREAENATTPPWKTTSGTSHSPDEKPKKPIDWSKF